MDVIAERELRFLALGADHEIAITVRVGRPVKRAEGWWACPIEIDDPEAPQPPTHTDGADSMQALQSAFQMIHDMLGPYKRAGTIRLDDCDTTGFPPWPQLAEAYDAAASTGR
jgi:hypothetical protein